MAVVAACAPFALRQADRLSGAGFDVSGSPSARVEAELASGVPVDARPAVLGAVLTVPPGAPARDVRRVVAALRRAGAPLPRLLAASAYGRTGTIVLPFEARADDFRAPEVARGLRKRLGGDGTVRVGRVRATLVGSGALWAALLDRSTRDLARAERRSLPVVALVLVAVLGSLAAVALPLVLGGAAVAVTAAALWWLSGAFPMSIFASTVAGMIGLGVAVDYGLFIVARYREELAAGASIGEARDVAMATSGRAVRFSGAAVIVALAGLLLVPVAAVRSLGAAAMLVVAVAVLGSATLVPALLALVGAPAGVPAGRRRWADAVVGRPRLVLAVGAAVVAGLALPAIGLHVGDRPLHELPASDPARVAVAAAGVTAPLKVLVAPGALGRAVAVLRGDNGVERTSVRLRTRDRRFVLVVVTPRGDAGPALVRRLRRELPAGTLVGGDTAAQADFEAAVMASLWKVVAWALAVGAVVLLLMLRSPALALVGVVTTAASVAAAFGVLALVFPSVDTITVPLIVAAVFGLSMDYQIFLLARIAERRSVRDGLALSARTITGAAAVMVAVFVVFAVGTVPAVREVAVGAAVAVAIDATVMRLAVLPAAVALLRPQW